MKKFEVYENGIRIGIVNFNKELMEKILYKQLSSVLNITYDNLVEANDF